jgi:Na+/melibiose symporter-like transporter
LPDVTSILSFDWLEGSRTFSIVFGTVTSLACLSLALPILYWCLPASRKWIFTKESDPHLLLQIGFGVLSISMAFADALCRFIPHPKLGFVHPAFFLTTCALVLLLGPRVLGVALASKRVRSVGPRALVALATALVALVAFPISAVVKAFS